MTFKPGHSIGRPSVFSREIQDKIIEVIRDGNYRQTAARCVGIGNRTLSGWIEAGKKDPEGPYGVFLQRILEAEAQAEMDQVRNVLRGAAQDPKYATWYLTHKFPQRWAGVGKDIRELQKDMAEQRKAAGLPPFKPGRDGEEVAPDHEVD